MTLDTEELRSHFPALRDGTAFFDGPGGTQTPVEVADAIHRTLTSPLSNRGSITPAESNAERAVAACRSALADLLGAPSETIAFGRSMTALTFEFSRSLSTDWSAGDEVLVSRLDHNANVHPWLVAAERRGATVRYIDFDPESAELTLDHVREVLTDRTRLVALTAASNLLGTMPDISAVAEAAHEVGALVYVDGVHYTAHTFVDVAALGADFFGCSPYKFLGPHCAAITGRRGLMEQLSPDKLSVSTDASPERFELGTLPYELMAGTTAAVDFIARLGGAGPDRRTRLEQGMRAIEQHEDALRSAIESGLVDHDEVTVHSRASRRTPTLLVSLAERDEAALSRFLAERGINAPTGTFYADGAAERVGLGAEGALRIGLAPYNTEGDVHRLLEAVDAYVRSARR